MVLLVLVCATLCLAQAPDEQFVSNGQYVESGRRLPDGWTAKTSKTLQLGQCVAQLHRGGGMTGSIVYSNGYNGDGGTCSFNSWMGEQPKLMRDGYVIAMSTDLYMGFHYPDDWRNAPNRSPPWGDLCNYLNNAARYNESNSDLMCGQGCGECYKVTGNAGTQTYMVLEINDINCCGILFQGGTLVLGNGNGFNVNVKGVPQGPTACRNFQATQPPGTCNLAVSHVSGPAAITIKKVPCPVEGDIRLGIRCYIASGNHCELTPLHFRVGITDMWVQGRDAAENPTGWKWVPRDWINRFLFESTEIPALSGFIYGASPSKTFDVRFRSQAGQMLVCTQVWNPDANSLQRLMPGCQFPDPGVDETPCPQPSPPKIVGDSFKSRNGLTPCADNVNTGGCNMMTEPAQLFTEWRVWDFANFSPPPVFNYAGDCHVGNCIDLNTAVGLPEGYLRLTWGTGGRFFSDEYKTGLTSLHLWAKCKSGPFCTLRVAIENPCPLQTVSLNVSDTWQEKIVDFVQLQSGCTGGWFIINFRAPIGDHVLLDETEFWCDNAPCPPDYLKSGNVRSNASNTNTPFIFPPPSGGYIAGIVIGALVGLAVLVVAGILVWKRLLQPKMAFSPNSRSEHHFVQLEDQ